VRRQLVKIISLTLFFLLTLFSLTSTADEQSLIEFSKNKQWLKLLHYKAPHKSKSYITSPDFFLSTSPFTSSLQELKATIAAFYRPINKIKSSDDHALCRFPARRNLIQSHLNLSTYGNLPLVECTQYKAWRQQIKSDSISLIFASGYMSNPASMYGHLLLKFSSLRSNSNMALLDNSLNYGAIVPNNENPLMYVLKGIFGGYNASFSDQRFYKHKHNYGNVELRDMWEYKLALTPKDISFIIQHLWEILPIKFDYYFIDENCAYHFAKLIELVLDEPLINNESLWVLPNIVTTGLAKAKYKNKSLLAETHFIPSRETVLLNYYEQLTIEQKKISATIISKNFSFMDPMYEILNDNEKKIIVESLFQYINVAKQKGINEGVIKKNKQKLIRERLKLSTGKAISYNKDKFKVAPHLARKPSKVSFGVATIAHSKLYTTAGFRMTYFDDLTSSLGLSEFSNLEMIDVEIIADKSQAKILKLDLIDIKSLYLPSIPWENKLASAWSVRAGYEQLSNNCIDCGIYFAEGSVGKSARIGNDGLGFATIGGKAYFGEESDVDIYAKLGFLTSITKNIKAKVEVQKTSNIALGKYSSSVKLGLSYEFFNHWDLRFFLERKEATFTALTLNYYWGF